MRLKLAILSGHKLLGGEKATADIIRVIAAIGADQAIIRQPYRVACPPALCFIVGR